MLEPCNQIPLPETCSTIRSADSLNVNNAPLITLPITMTGIRPGDPQQSVHIQVMNPNALQSTKFQMGTMSIPAIQSLQPNSTTVLTVAYDPTDRKLISNGFSQGMTVVAALQPHDLQILAHAQQQLIQHHIQDELGLRNQETEVMKKKKANNLEDTKRECDA